jgi:hypothetical protein
MAVGIGYSIRALVEDIAPTLRWKRDAGVHAGDSMTPGQPAGTVASGTVDSASDESTSMDGILGDVAYLGGAGSFSAWQSSYRSHDVWRAPRPSEPRCAPRRVATVAVAAPFFLISLGERYIASSLTGILTAVVPLTVALPAVRLAPSERPRPDADESVSSPASEVFSSCSVSTSQAARSSCSVARAFC